MQALAAAGGMSSINMLTGFLSGYAGSSINNRHFRKQQEQLDLLTERIRILEQQGEKLDVLTEIMNKYEKQQGELDTLTKRMTRLAEEMNNMEKGLMLC